MKISALQKARYSYNPKLPLILRENVKQIKPVMGKPTSSVSDQEALKKLFPNTYGLPTVTFEKGENAEIGKKLNVGVILSGGQAPG
ncbi:MAG: diphosphate--fructose-6-phosphate 1-phosphotransferase, partial [Sphaerochaetaceae bacterium]|nr:diphosphate--fructose-6-phosphate 1-phosphotransferase [Sphaerochaetaceae bacterium]